MFTASTNGKELHAIVHDGLLCEVLSWKMDVEEPNAAAIISTAMNEVSSMAMRTTEFQAMQMVKCEIIVQMTKDVSQKVAFESTVARVKAILGPAVADLDFIQLFEFLISNGVGTNTYVDEFLDWAAANINPNVRQLRFAAFTPINKMGEAPRSRMAAAKRAYRGKPIGGFCPSPESVWGNFTLEQLTPLEELLRFFHTQCKHLMSEWVVKSRIPPT